MYPIISNKGCLLESVSSRSKFEPRQKSSEIRLSLQTFTFAMGEEVFIHCKLLAWDPNGLDSTKKACHFVEGHGWELLDNLAQSNLCDCCESTCKSRRQRSVASEEENVLEEVLMKAVKEKLAEEVKEKTRDKPWNEYKGTAKALFDEAMAQLINS
ncbi:Aspartate--ammonia ligase [Dissostichus eleginoides]|uniref:Aspartate--ammonia ligase n=1 Tax=Dissostichus eleginoides TaxID=100907 RepID=A0AAD9FE56_DISEL|nr:Aspartate--ammonia ligase [Dissostichus eleginoides]